MTADPELDVPTAPASLSGAIGPDTPVEGALDLVRAWVDEHVPGSWREAASHGGTAEIRRVRSLADYEAWYPVFGGSGLVAPTWPVDCGGLGLAPATARRIDEVLAPFNLGRLNPLGLNLAAPALFAHGTEWQRRRFLPAITRAEEWWCQLFSEPGAGSDLASLATRAERDGEGWRLTGQKVWTTWAHRSDFAVVLARTDPNAPKRRGITYFLLDLHQPGVEVRPLRHLTGEIDFNEVFLDGAWVPDDQRVGDIGDGWRVANATLSGERQMVSGAGSGGVDRIGGSGAARVIRLARERSAAGQAGGWDDPTVRQRLVRLYSDETIRHWTNLRVRANARANRPPGPETSIGKVIQGRLNQEIQLAAVDLLGPGATAWEPASGAVTADPTTSDRSGDAASDHPTPDAAERYAATLPYEVNGMLRSRANTIEGGTTEVNKNILGERVLGLPREPDPWHDRPWTEVPRS